MALWNKIQTNLSLYEQVQKRYNGPIPLIVRHYLADWLEELFLHTDCAQFAMSNLEGQASLFFMELYRMLNEKSAEVHLGQDAKIFLQQAAQTVCNHFDYARVDLYTSFKEYLKSEQLLVQQMEQGLSAVDETITIKVELDEIYQKVRFNSEATKCLESNYESFLLLLHNITNMNAHCMQEPKNMEKLAYKDSLELTKQQKLVVLTKNRIEIVDSFKEVIKRTRDSQNKILSKHLENWKYVQSRTRNGFEEQKVTSLNEIQRWFESLGDIIWMTKLQINKVIELKDKLNIDEGNLPNYLPTLLEEIKDLLKTLIFNSIVIEKQPPLVVQKGNKFKNPVSLRLLTGKILNSRHTEQKITVSIECDVKIAALLDKSTAVDKYKEGEMENNKGRWEYEQSTNQFTAHFRNLMVKDRPKNPDSKSASSNSVVEEKTCLFFKSEFSLGDLHFSLWTYSLPIVITVHANQNLQAWSAIIWDAAYATLNRHPFVVPNEGNWNDLSAALSAKFNLETGRGLSAEDLKFLYEKAVNGRLINDKNLISWNKFCKDPIPGYKYTLWEWFYNAVKVTKEHLDGSWKAGLIAGFISRTTAEEKLKVCAPGTFLIRFSDGEPGAVTIAYRGDLEVVHIQPFTGDTLKTRCLSDSIVDLDELTVLYPNIPKKEFKQYAVKNEQKPLKEGYVAAGVHMSLPGSRSSISRSSIGSPMNGFLDTDSAHSFISDVTTMDYQMDPNANYINSNNNFNMTLPLQNFMMTNGQT